ncbi:MAG: four helix bundle suffix domain-containing protein [Bacteroides sp.]|nr:four helix bundle suffix domain-containing protein [Bacteroides sp.]MCM1096386.1 four helix bundle suffix domain-containing protein [Terasakiella sp.]
MSNIHISSTASYLGLDSWVMANIVQLATLDFCRRFLNRTNDPCGRMYDQMTQAARSCQANIAEGSARRQTSAETEMKLLDVARASLSELAGDYMYVLMSRGEAAWPQTDSRRAEIHDFKLDRPAYGPDFLHDLTAHIVRQYARIAHLAKSEDVSVAANSILILCTRVIKMLERQIAANFERFKAEGGFTENLTKARTRAVKEAAAESGAPRCPRCGGPMRQRMVKRGARQGTNFWGCINYPQCDGLINI